MKGISVDASRSQLINNIIVVLISFYGIAKQDYSMDDTSWFEGAIIEVFAPIQRGTLTVREKLDYFIDHYITIVDISKNNEELKEQIQELERELFQLNEVQRENLRLKKLLDFGKDIPRKKVLAQVVSWDSSNEFKVLRINKGKNNGIKIMSPVITVNGLVGYIYRVTPNYADILTILDQNNRVDSIVTRTRSHGIVEGLSNFKLYLKYVTRTESVDVGDEVITAGLGKIYPKGIRIGTILDVDKESYGITQRIEVKPAVDFQRLEEVVVLTHEIPAPTETLPGEEK